MPARVETKEEREAFGERLREWRELRGLSRPQVLAMLGAGAPGESTLRNIEGGHQGTGRALRAALERLIDTGRAYGPPTGPALEIGEPSTRYGDTGSSDRIAEVLAISREHEVEEAAKAVARATGQPYLAALAVVIREKLKQL